MNKLLIEQNYLLVPDFISTTKAIELHDEFVRAAAYFKWRGDTAVRKSASVYNYLPALEMLCGSCQSVTDHVEEQLLPTYAYGRLYKSGSSLHRHTDRAPCELSVTLHLNGDQPWDIKILTPNGPKGLHLSPGDAMIYRGTIAPHWRTEYTGESYSQFFLHYVLSRGPNAFRFFDKSNFDMSGDQKQVNKFNNYVDSQQRTQVDQECTE